MSDVNSPTSSQTEDAVEPDGASEVGSVHVIVAPTRTRIVLSGEIDSSLSTELQDAATDAETAARPVEVDARHVLFMDSSGVTLLARLASRTPGRLRIIRPPDVVRFLLEVTHIGELVDVVDIDPGFDGPGAESVEDSPEPTPPGGVA